MSKLLKILKAWYPYSEFKFGIELGGEGNDVYVEADIICGGNTNYRQMCPTQCIVQVRDGDLGEATDR